MFVALSVVQLFGGKIQTIGVPQKWERKKRRNMPQMHGTGDRKMSIKPIEALPPVPESSSRRKMITEDIMTAIAQKIKTFEFEGDYNYKYLAQYAREQAEFIFRKDIYRLCCKKVRDKLKKEYGIQYIFPTDEHNYKGRFIRIHQRKGEDRNHVYAEIDYDFADKFEEILEADTRKHYQECEERKTQRNETEVQMGK